MNDDARRELREFDDVLDLTAPSRKLRARLDLNDEKVRTLWQAILQRRVTTLRYFGRNRSRADRPSGRAAPARVCERRVVPHRILPGPPAGARVSPRSH